MWLRQLTVWTWMKDYFPVSLEVPTPVDPTKKYIFGYHPHGIIGVGCFVNFATEANNVSGLLKGIDIRPLTLNMNFRIPFWGHFLSLLGVCDAGRTSIVNVLKKGPGNAVLLVLGGAKEALDAHPGVMDLTLKDRYGFVKLALEEGASLIPIISFGENEIYDQVDNPKGSTLRWIQDTMQRVLGFSVPLVRGRGVFTYSFGLLPHRVAIRTVVGPAVDVPHVPQPSKETIREYHQKYMDAVIKLFEEWKDSYTKMHMQIPTLRFVQ